MGTFKNCSEENAHGLGSPEAVSFGEDLSIVWGGWRGALLFPASPALSLHPIRSKSERAAALNKKHYLKPPCD